MTKKENGDEPGTDTGDWTLLTDASDLEDGMNVIIAAADYEKGMAGQNTNNRKSVDVTKSGNTLTEVNENVVIFKLVKEGNYWRFLEEGKGYLYAANSSSNHLKTEETPDANANATITVSNNEATVKFQGSNSHNLLRYNSNNYIFSCYASGQQPIAIYYQQISTTAPKVPTFEPGAGEYLWDYTIASEHVLANNDVMITCTNADKIHYKINGSAESSEKAEDGSIIIEMSKGTPETTLEAWGENTSTGEVGKHAVVTYKWLELPGTPVFSVPSGSQVDKGTEVTISCENATQIEYALTVNGTTGEEIVANAPVTLTITKDCSITATGLNAKGHEGEITEAVYTVTPPVAPTFIIDKGTDNETELTGENNEYTYSFDGSADVTISGAKEGETTYYVIGTNYTDKAEVFANGEVFTEPVSVLENTTIQAVTVDDGRISAISTLTLTKKSVETGKWTLLRNESGLKDGMKVVIAAADYEKGMAGQNTNNRKSVDVTKSHNNNWLTWSEEDENENGNVAVFKLEKITDGDDTFWRFYDKTEDGYLYAANSNNNYQLKTTKGDPDDNAKATITISNNEATVLFRGENTNNRLLYNASSNSQLFTCYAPDNTNQKPVSIYYMPDVAPTALTITTDPVLEGENADTDKAVTVTLTADGTYPDITYTVTKGGETGEVMNYTGPFVLTDICDYTISATASNTEGIVTASKSFTISVVPITYLTITTTPELSEEFKSAPPVTVSMFADGTAPVITYTITKDDEEESDVQTYAEPFVLTEVGKYLIKATAKNAKYTKEAEQTVIIIPVAPTEITVTTDLELDENNASEKPVKVTLAALNGTPSTITYTITKDSGDESEAKTYTEPFDLTEVGTYLIKVIATNVAGSMTLEKTITIRGIKPSAPVVTITPGTQPYYPVSMTIECAEGYPEPALSYSLNNGETWIEYTGEVTFEEVNKYTVIAKAENVVGETLSEVKSFEITEAPQMGAFTFRLVRSTADLNEDDDYIFVYVQESSSEAKDGMGLTPGLKDSGHTYLTNAVKGVTLKMGEDGTSVNELAVLDTEATDYNIVKLHKGAADGTWRMEFTYGDESKGTYAVPGINSANITWSDSGDDLTFSFGTGNGVMVTHGIYNFTYNASTPRWGGYKSPQSTIYLYRRHIADLSKVMDPEFSPSSDNLQLGGSVTIKTSPVDAQIHYMISDTDRDDVTIENTTWTDYDGPVVMTEIGDFYVYAYGSKENLDNSNVVKKHYIVAENFEEIFELVTKDTKLKENDRIIIVSYQKSGGSYQALTGITVSNRDYNLSEPIEEAENIEGQARKLVLSDDSPITVFTLEKWSDDPEEGFPWLLRTKDSDGEYKYISSTGKHVLEYVDLPEEDQRHTIQVKIAVEDMEDNYLTDHKENRILSDCAIVQIVSTDLKDNGFVRARYNPDGTYKHFNFYGEGQPISSTYPVQIYRATNVVLAPSVTVYPLDLSQEDEAYEETPVAAGVLPFYNPVKIVIAENPRTNSGASLMFNWQNVGGVVPVASEYTVVDGTAGNKGSKVEMYLDGFTARYTDLNGVEKNLNLLSESSETEYLKSDFRAMSSYNDKNSRSNAREFRFKTMAPVLKRETKNIDGTDKSGITVNNAEGYTRGAVYSYKIEGSDEELTVPAGGFIELAPQQTVTVYAKKDGYETSSVDFSDLTVSPEARAIQLLELRQTGLDKILAVKEGNVISDDEKAAMGIVDDKATRKVYLTHRSGLYGLKYYILSYTTGADGEIDNIVLADVDTDAAQAVIADPHTFVWTPDYYVYGLQKSDFVNAVPFYQNPEMYVIDGDRRIPVTETLLNYYDEANATAENDFNPNKEVTYYGTVLRRNAKLGTDYLRTELNYEARSVEDDSHPFRKYTTETITKITPQMPTTFHLKYDYETNRVEMERDGDFHFTTTSSVPGHDEEIELTFRKEHFALRHFDCVFSFHRPNVSDDIIDNYDIVYDVRVKTVDSEGEEVDQELNPVRLEGRFIDPLTSAELNAREAQLQEELKNDQTLTEEQRAEALHDGLHRYEFIVSDVHPNSEVNPNLKINSVTYIPRDEDSDYNQLVANYKGEGPVADSNESLLLQYAQDITAANLTRVSAPVIELQMGLYYPNDTDLGWQILSHKTVSNYGQFGLPQVHENVTVEAPFMYHLEVATTPFGDDHDSEQMGTESVNLARDRYFSHEYVIPHENAICGQCQHKYSNDNDSYTPEEDPFAMVVGDKYHKDCWGEHLPTVYLTPIYFFLRSPETSVEREPALSEYVTGGTTGGNKVPRRAGEEDTTASEEPGDSNILVVRGSRPASFTPGFDNIWTGVEEVGADSEVRWEGNNLILPAGAAVYNPQGVRVNPEGLDSGVYLIRFATGRTVKIRTNF